MSENSKSIIEALNQAGEISFVPKGMSMYPFIKGDKQSVIIKKYTSDYAIEILDVILYVRENGRLVLHRVIALESNGYIVGGDGQFSSEHVKLEQIKGVMTGYYKGETFVNVKDEKYKNRVRKWYNKSVLYRKIRLKLYRIFNRKYK